MSRVAWLDGGFVPLAEARVSALDRGFLFADGIYEVTAVLGGRLVDSARHLARLARSAAALGLALPLDPAAIEAIERELIARNALAEGTVYLQLTRGEGERDFLPAAETPPTLLLFTQAKALVDNPAATTGLAVVTVPDLRWARRDLQSGMLLAQVLAKREAAARGAQEAWMIERDAEGRRWVTEGASSTALILTAAGTLVARPESEATLPGCTWAAIDGLARGDGIAVERRAFTLDEALAAREAMLASASNFVLPVVRIDERPVADGRPGPIAARLRALYVAAARG